MKSFRGIKDATVTLTYSVASFHCAASLLSAPDHADRLTSRSTEMLRNIVTWPIGRLNITRLKHLKSTVCSANVSPCMDWSRQSLAPGWPCSWRNLSCATSRNSFNFPKQKKKKRRTLNQKPSLIDLNCPSTREIITEKTAYRWYMLSPAILCSLDLNVLVRLPSQPSTLHVTFHLVY